MESAPLLTSVQQLNFSILHNLRDAARNDLVSACCRFGLSREQLDVIGNLTPNEVLGLVARMGDEALFAPRADLGTLLSIPSALLPLVAASRPRMPLKQGPGSAVP
jgi:hypothetical protein